MDLPGLKPLFGQRVTVVTSIGKEFIGTLEPVPGSQNTVSLAPVDAATANYYSFAINGVAALGVDIISFAQLLPPAPTS